LVEHDSVIIMTGYRLDGR